jgi:hypothetical protein
MIHSDERSLSRDDPLPYIRYDDLRKLRFYHYISQPVQYHTSSPTPPLAPITILDSTELHTTNTTTTIMAVRASFENSNEYAPPQPHQQRKKS